MAGNANAIGYVSIGTAEFEAGQGTPIKLLPLEGVAATVENVRNETFSLARPLNLVVKSAPTGAAKSYIEFAQSKEVQISSRNSSLFPCSDRRSVLLIVARS